MKCRRAARLALVAASLSACVAYQAPPELPQHADPPIPIRIYSLWVPGPFENAGAVQYGTWLGAVQVAVRLERAGFVPVVVRRKSEIPIGAPYVVQVYPDRDPCWRGFRYLTLFSGGLIPVFHCEAFGDAFELHRSFDAPAQRIDTYWTVDWVFGWLALPIGGSKGWAAGFVGGPPGSVGSAREAPALRAALLEALESP